MNKIMPKNIINKFTQLLLLFFLSYSSLLAKEIRVLAIGNSFSDDAIEHYLFQLGEANGDTLIIGNLAIGGASLEMHYNNSLQNSPAYSYRKIVNGIRTVSGETTLEYGIEDEKWDYISLQQVSQNAGLYDTFFPYLPHLINYVKSVATNPDMKLVWHMTWAYAQNATHPGFANYGKSQLEMYKAIVNTANKVVSDHPVCFIIPSGTAIQNARTSSLGDTMCSDGFHLEPTYGRYTAACVWYETLTGNCVVGNAYKPDAISDFKAFIAQLSAHLAIVNPNRITDLSICEEN